MDTILSCKDTSDILPFYLPKNLFLKPVATLNITAHFPNLRLSGRSISSKTLMESIKSWAAPDFFCSLKIIQSTVEFIQFEGEIENRSKLQNVLSRLNGKSVILPSFQEPVRVKATVTKPDFPSKHDWNSFFRDAKNMNEMKPGERPDTLYLSELPCKWFSSKLNPEVPSERVLRKIFQQFGEVQVIDIPSIDPYRNQMRTNISGLKTFSFNQDSTFDVFIQFKDYLAFVKAMDALRGMKLLRKDDNKAFVANLKVTFDKTKHLSDNSIQKRKIEREKLIANENQKCTENRLLEEKVLMKRKERDSVKIEGEVTSIDQKDWEHKKNVVSRNFQNADKPNTSTAEENILILSKRKLESIRLLTELLKRLKESKDKKCIVKAEDQSTSEQKWKEILKNKTNSVEKSLGKVKVLENKYKNYATKSKKRESYEDKKGNARKSVRCSSVEKYKKNNINVPSVTERQFCKDKGKILVDNRWSHRRNQSPSGDQHLFRRKETYYSISHERHRSYLISQHMLCNATQKMYYKYFRSISKSSYLSSETERNLPSRSESDTKRHKFHSFSKLSETQNSHVNSSLTSTGNPYYKHFSFNSKYEGHIKKKT